MTLENIGHDPSGVSAMQASTAVFSVSLSAGVKIKMHAVLSELIKEPALHDLQDV